MEENQYYMTTEHIYGMSRKCFIFVHKVCNKVFFYNFIDDWQLVEVDRKTTLKIDSIETPNYRGKLEDKDYFKKLNRETLILSSNCP